eukprot:gnl/TRDRNA2_/TRDRNA2_62470_c0_seq1.p1 gnl/TRDRNA2_/TRDRNA2_62470_c0~~gnl/TRDRNA2_/TRDRNA2_62470_c0_seq1.p1  ORF type:complete len:209 (+),score=15.81 gnl/TRDRNA2_/TRDRNA2_62470_c0_seq1:89-715(+)
MSSSSAAWAREAKGESSRVSLGDGLQSAFSVRETTDLGARLLGDDPKVYKEETVKHLEAGRLVQVLLLACCLTLMKMNNSHHTFGIIACFGALCNSFGVMTSFSLITAIRTMPEKHVRKFVESNTVYLSILSWNFLAGMISMCAALCGAAFVRFAAVWAWCISGFAVLLLMLYLYQLSFQATFLKNVVIEREAEHVQLQPTTDSSAPV